LIGGTSVAAEPFSAPSTGNAVGARNIRRMQKRRATEADFDKRRLHAGHHARHPTFVDIADITAFQRTFDMHFLQHAVFDHRDARFARGDVDQDFLRHDSPSMKLQWMVYSRDWLNLSNTAELLDSAV